MTTKERITEEALTLFSNKGFKGTSVKNIADAVGIKDASLYKHFKSKQEIFDSIVTLIKAQISDLSIQLGMPQYDMGREKTSEFFVAFGEEELLALCRKVFLFYLTDSYISRFRKLAYMEQYQNPQIYEMYHQIFLENATHYQTKLFEQMMENGIIRQGNAKVVAINFYAPIFLFLNMYTGQEEKAEEACAGLEEQVLEFYRVYWRKES